MKAIHSKHTHFTKKIITLFLLFTILLLGFSAKNIFTSSQTTEAVEIADSTVIQQIDTSTISAQEFVSNITVGWNLGNSLDSCTASSNRNDGSSPTSFYETAWGNPVVTKELIDTIAASGFNTIRIPVTWYYNTYEQDGHIYIYEEWLARVAEVVQYALDNDMYVILNSHHDAPLIWADLADIEEVSNHAEDLWSQISEYFKDYNDHLLFEGYNELNTKDNSWSFSENASKATNILNQLFVDTVRSTGGNNATRILICGTYLNSTSDEVLNRFVLPTDTIQNRLIIEVHAYDTAYNQDISNLFLRLDEFSKLQNAPVIIGEFGSNNSFVPLEYRAKHASNYVARAGEYNIKCLWWDDGSDYQIIDRSNYTITRPDILEALMNPACFETQNLASYHFKSISDFSFSALDANDGSLIASSQGSITLNLNDKGLPVTPGLGYRLTLNTTASSDGIRMTGIAFYNSNLELLLYTPVDAKLEYDITAPEDAAYMRVSFHNPWGYRSLYEYTYYFINGDLSVDIAEYPKVY